MDARKFWSAIAACALAGAALVAATAPVSASHSGQAPRCNPVLGLCDPLTGLTSSRPRTAPLDNRTSGSGGGVTPQGCHLRVGSRAACLRWSSAYDNAQGHGTAQSVDEVASAIASDPTMGRIFVTGVSWDNTTGMDAVTIAYDADTGQQLWLARFNGSGNNLDEIGYDVAVSPDGTQVFVTGNRDTNFTFTHGPSPTDTSTVAYDAATGEQLWASKYGQPYPKAEGTSTITVSPSGDRIYVAGGTANFSDESYRGYLTIAYDAATGKRLWVSRYVPRVGIGGYDTAWDSVISSDGSQLSITGASGGVGSYGDIATVSYDTTTGRQLWAQRYTGPSFSDDQAFSIGIAPDDSRVFVGGYGYDDTSGGFSDFATIAYSSATGDQEWLKFYDGGSNRGDQGIELEVGPGGRRIYVTGGAQFAPNGGVATVAYMAKSGKQAWASTFDPDPLGNSETGNGIKVSPNGHRLYIAASAPTYDDIGQIIGYDLYTVAYATSSGTQIGSYKFNSAEDGSGKHFAGSVYAAGSDSLVLQGNRHVFETGYSWYPTDPQNIQDYLTLSMRF